ncbi:hypothetical protein MBANPS3_000991 [Mucor bainieri]
MWAIFKAIFYLSILTFGFISFTGSESPVANRKNSLDFMELTKQGLAWRARKTLYHSQVGQLPCTYEVKMESKLKDQKGPVPFLRSFFDESNVDVSVTAECPEVHLPEQTLEDIRNIMLDYDNLTELQQLVINYRVKHGYYKPIILEKSGLPFAWISINARRWCKVALYLFFFHRIVSLLYRKFCIGN